MSSDIGYFYNELDLFAQLQVESELEELPHELVEYHEIAPSPNTITWQNPASWLIPIVLLVVIICVFYAGARGTSANVQQAGETAVSQSQSASSNISKYDVATLAFTAPYEDYTITQGIHGMSYGHMAIDIAAGRGEPILSPINGTITQLYIDEYGNPTLMIENEVYQVIFLHGDYSVSVGDTLEKGQILGTESNKGYTMDMAGNLCYNREWCGNHTHLNVFDKRIQANINPLDLFE